MQSNTMYIYFNFHFGKFPILEIFFMEIDPKLEVVDTKEENVWIYRRYTVYRERSTRYFMEKNQRGDIYVKIAKISTIYRLGEINWRFCEKIAYGGNKSSIFQRYFLSFMQSDLMAQITSMLIRRPRCDSNGNIAIQRPYCSQFFI